jgi:glycosyltransferase involved in cell wall biosynthesis
MKIGLDGIILQSPVAGSHRYFEQLLTGLSELDVHNAYEIFANARMMRERGMPRQANLHYRDVQTPRWMPNALRQQFYRDWHARGELDLLHSAVFVPPLGYARPSVATIFDLTFERFPETMTRVGRMWWKFFAWHGITRATRIITLSESTRRDLHTCLNVPAEKIRVIYPYARALFAPQPNALATRARYPLPARYLLFVGTLEPRKNIELLIRVFARARQIANVPHRLVLVGQRGWFAQNIFRMIQELELNDQVIVLGYVPDDDLPAIYSGADLFVYLSRYEGFGLPVLEAMACGAPVLVSDSSALPEAVGDAGICVALDDPNIIANEIAQLLGDPARRAALSERGLKRALTFSMENSIRETLQVYDDAAKN